jgi:hypothetical protein
LQSVGNDAVAITWRTEAARTSLNVDALCWLRYAVDTSRRNKDDAHLFDALIAVPSSAPCRGS